MKEMRRPWLSIALVAGGIWLLSTPGFSSEGRLPGTEALPKTPDNLPAVQQQQILDYLQRRIAAAQRTRDEQWQPNFSSADAYIASLETHRTNCQQMLGLDGEKTVSRRPNATPVAETKRCRVERVAIPLGNGLAARGLFFRPTAAGHHPVVIACADAQTSPEQAAGVIEGSQPAEWLANLVARGAAVYLPAVDRTVAGSSLLPDNQE